MLTRLVLLLTLCSFGPGASKRTELGACSILPPPGYSAKLYRGNPLSAITYRAAVGEAAVSLKLTRFAPVPGMDKADAKRLQNDAKFGERAISDAIRSVRQPEPVMTHRSTRFRGYPALEQRMLEHGPNRVTETFILKFLVSDNEYWVSWSVSAPEITRSIRSRAQKNWSFFEDHLEIGKSHR